MSDAFVGFYWTLPVYWAGFRSLPTDVDAASAKSWTIRYQRERVREWAKDEAVRLIDEMVFIDVRTDIGTSTVLETLERARACCENRRAKLVYVKFSKLNGWRPHKHLKAYFKAHDFALPIDPEPVTIAGLPYEPSLHFKNWRQIDRNEATKRSRQVDRALSVLTKQIPSGRSRCSIIAESLNEQQIPTKTGKSWTVDSVRTELRRRRTRAETAHAAADETLTAG